MRNGSITYTCNGCQASLEFKDSESFTDAFWGAGWETRDEDGVKHALHFCPNCEPPPPSHGEVRRENSNFQAVLREIVESDPEPVKMVLTLAGDVLRESLPEESRVFALRLFKLHMDKAPPGRDPFQFAALHANSLAAGLALASYELAAMEVKQAEALQAHGVSP